MSISTVPDAYLVVAPEGAQRQVHRLERLPAVIGRSPDCEVMINDASVSRRHARVDWRDSRFVIEDLKSTNGTWLNGEPLSVPATVTDGDVISVAGVRVEFQVNAPTVVMPQASATSRVAVNAATHEVSVDGVDAKLSPKEYLFVAALHRHAGGVASHADLAREVWPEFEDGVPDENIHQLATRVRRKLEPDPSEPRYVLTVKGFGYRLAPND